MRFFYSLLLAVGVIAPLSAQTIRGVVIDKITESALPGALIDLPGLAEPRGAVTDSLGGFVIKNLAPGRYQLRVRYLGFDDEILPDVLVTSGKDADLRILLEESTQALQVVTITGTNKAKPVNRLAKVSAIALNPESVMRYSGGRNNIARMAGNFAGIGVTDDYQNDIVVRGNSPTGLLWRLEGVPVPNPGHLSTYGNTGGSFNALNPNLLGQSDFLTGAFPAEYGNSIAGVMDMNFRTGNKERFEFTGQVGAWSGVEATAEGPLWRRQNGSFLVGYRYSFVDLLQGLGVRAGGNYVPQYQDLNWKLDFGKAKHRFSLFGLAGKSHIFVSGADVDPENPYHPPTRDSELGSELAIVGLRYQWLIDSVSYWRTVLAFSHNQMYSKGWERDPGTSARTQWLEETNREDGLRLSSLWQRRHTKRLTLRAGILLHSNAIDTRLLTRQQTPDFAPVRDYEGRLWLYEAFAQVQYKVKKRYSLNIGLHTQHLPLSGKTSVEPRAAFKLKLPNDNDLILAYGYHSQTPATAALFFADSSGAAPNHGLDFLRSQQWVLSWAKKWDSGWRLRGEAYFQGQSRVPVRQQADGFSLLNFGSSFALWDFSDLRSTGKGRNYGLEGTLSKSYKDGFYSLFTVSLFQSEYQGSDGVWRSTAFNSRYIANALIGKEFALGRRLVLTADTKLSLSGGRWYTPIDLAQSKLFGSEVYDEQQPYSEQYPLFFRWDAKLGLRYNARRLTHHLFLDFTNLSNRRNVFAYRYFQGMDTTSTQYQLGFTPDFVYRIQF
ncbi:MAG: TonB-dependent receptor [Saprospiraceae bacterium]|nr:TonB-dependent receptor [Saprospiraceae bacterium]